MLVSLFTNIDLFHTLCQKEIYIEDDNIIEHLNIPLTVSKMIRQYQAR